MEVVVLTKLAIETTGVVLVLVKYGEEAKVIQHSQGGCIRRRRSRLVGNAG